MPERKRSMRIALAQFDVKSGETNSNLATASEYVTLASRQGAKLVVLPELWSELFRKYALKGARLVILCAQWPALRLEHWRTLVRARAIENQFFVVACNRTGWSQGTRFGGHSMIVDPWGNVLGEESGRPALITADIDFQAVNESRSRIPSLNDSRSSV